MKVRIVFPVIFLLLFGCAGVKPIPQETLNEIKRIGAISILENNLKIRYVGLTVFNNFDVEAPVSEWKIDDYVVETLKEEIENNTTWTYQVIEYEKDPLLFIYEKGNHKEQIETELAAISKKNELDAIIFVKREWFQDPILHDQNVHGYGIYQRNVIFGKMSAMYLVAHVTIYETTGMTPLCEFYLIDDQKIENEYFTKDFNNLTEKQVKEIETWIKNAIKKELVEELAKHGILKTF
ncbi:MAG: hypothetical protein PVH87_02615 [Desulfobacteraceae bacterium]|jgi:hypothetical protein